MWFVAHPSQMEDWGGRVPTMYDISGSAHWVNKCDVGLVVHRRHAGVEQTHRADAGTGVQGHGRGTQRVEDTVADRLGPNETLIRLLKVRCWVLARLIAEPTGPDCCVRVPLLYADGAPAIGLRLACNANICLLWSMIHTHACKEQRSVA